MAKKKEESITKKIKFEDIDFGDCDDELEVITKEEAQKKVAQSGEGRTVIVRGRKGELLLSSNKDDDTLSYMVKIALEEYEKNATPSYIN